MQSRNHRQPVQVQTELHLQKNTESIHFGLTSGTTTAELHVSEQRTSVRPLNHWSFPGDLKLQQLFRSNISGVLTQQHSVCVYQTAHESLAAVGHNIPLTDHTCQQANLCVSCEAPAGAPEMERVLQTAEEKEATGRNLTTPRDVQTHSDLDSGSYLRS